MVKNYKSKSKTRKSVIALFAATAVACSFAAACTPKEEESNKPVTKKEDVQLLKNGNFEFFNSPSEENIKDGKALYLIKTADNWSRSGDSSNAMSGVIGTSEKAWADMTDPELADKLAYNSDLSSTDKEYVDYNGMVARDVLYKDTYAALLADDAVADSYIKKQTYAGYFGITKTDGGYKLADGTPVYLSDTTEADNWEQGEFFLDAELTEPVRKTLIENPETHYGEYSEKDGKHYLGDRQIYLDDNGNYFLDEKLEEPCSNVLMVHNYPTNSNYNGIAQHYTSQTITLEANTAAEISVWVKTSDLKFDKGYSLLDDQDRGAFIEVVQTVAGTTVDSFKIKSINTEKIIRDNPDITEENNGWLQYTVYVNACDFGETTIQLNLGLGQSGSNAEKCTGYAFFDDVTVTKYVELTDEGCSYTQNAAKITEDVTCSLTDKDDGKIFIADKDLRGNEGDRCSKNFYYLVDLASENSVEHGYQSLNFSTDTATAKLTSEKSEGKNYASALSLDSNNVKNIGKADETYTLPQTLKYAIKTDGDLIGAFPANETAFGGSPYAAKLTEALTGDNGKLPGNAGNMLVMLSAQGAAYTTSLNNEAFKVGAGEYKIVSFWVKTSDMNGKTASTIKITDKADDKKTAQLTVDSTGVKTDIGDRENIYNGWVRCFFFVENDTTEDKEFTVDFCFGNTTIVGTTVKSYDYGWIAMADMQTLAIDEDVYNLASSGTYSLLFSFSEKEEEKTGTPFSEATATSDVKSGIANPSDYNGINGGSSMVSGSDYRENYDTANGNKFAGLINKDGFKNYANWQDIAQAFGNSDTDAVVAWNNVFGSDCYQPLIIVNNLREYYDKAEATETTFNNGNYYIKNEDGTFEPVASDATFDKDTEYYSLSKVLNYGYVGNSASVSSSSYATVSVKVMVSDGAVAHVYLVDSDTREVMGYTTPDVTFYYDEEGNVLKNALTDDTSESEHRDSIVYTPRNDGLYDGKDGKVYANLYNLVSSYKYYKFEHQTFYKDGKEVSFDNLKNGETYYTDAQCTKKASHFLCSSDGTRVYEYDGETDTYYYLVENKDGNKVRGIAVNNFDPQYARYTKSVDKSYEVAVGPTGGEWVTVNFFIHTGNEAKDYRLEVWSGERGSAGNVDGTATGAVAFDYSAYSVTESNYSDVISSYETNVINAYKNVLLEKGKLDALTSNSENIEYFEKQLVKDGVLTEDEIAAVKAEFGYEADYYTYTLYDSEAYVPFNAETAKEGETGYDYKISDFEETLVYFSYNDKELNSINVFADYSAVNQSVEIGKVDDGDDDDEEDKDSESGDVWLLVSSILLVVALVITLVSMGLRMLIKNIQRKKGGKLKSKNNYRQRQRYIKKLGLVKAEDDAAEAPEETPEDNAEENDEDAPAGDNDGTTEEPTEDASEETAEEVPAEEPVTETVTEETAPEDSAETAQETEAGNTEAQETKSGEAPADETPENKDGE